MRIELLKRKGKKEKKEIKEMKKMKKTKVELNQNVFRHCFTYLGLNSKVNVRCNWASISYGEVTNFEVDVITEKYKEYYVVTNPDFSFILNLMAHCYPFNLNIESKGDIDQEFKNDIFKTIDDLGDSITGFDIINDDYIKYKNKVYDVGTVLCRILKTINNFFSYDIQLKNDIVKKTDRLNSRIYEIDNVMGVVNYIYKFARETCLKKNTKDRNSEEIDFSINQIELWINSFSIDRLYE